MEEGIDAVTVHGLAKRLDCAPGALYRYFPSKEALIAELQVQVVEAAGRWVRRTVNLCDTALEGVGASAPSAALFRLLALARLYRELADEMPSQFRLMTMMITDPRELLGHESAQRAVLAATPLASIVRGVFVNATDAGALHVGDATDRALVFWSGLHGVMQMQMLRRLRHGLVDVDRLTEQFCDVTLRGWGAPTEALVEALRLLATIDEPIPLVRAAASS